MIPHWFSAFSRFRSAFLVAVATVAATYDAAAFNYAVVLAPPVQVNNSTCQSYVLAMALAMQEPAELRATYPWRIDDETELRILEASMRSAVVKAMRHRLGPNYSGKSASSRDDWRAAMKQLSFGEYTVIDRFFPTLDDMIQFLASRVPVRSKADTGSVITMTTPATLYFTSVKQVGGHSYSSGHIVSIIGIDMGGTKKPRELLLINSAARGDDNECLHDPSKYFGKAGWTNNYDIKTFDGKYLLNWLEPK